MPAALGADADGTTSSDAETGLDAVALPGMQRLGGNPADQPRPDPGCRDRQAGGIEQERRVVSAHMAGPIISVVTAEASDRCVSQPRPCFRSLPLPWSDRFRQGRLCVYVHQAGLPMRLSRGHRRP